MSDDIFSDNPELLAEFVSEIREHLQLLDDNLLALENEPGNTEILKALFRSAHSIKGASAYLKLDKIVDLTHSLENILDNLRKGKLVADGGVVQGLLKAVDLLRQLVDCFVDKKPDHEIAIEPVTAELGRLKSGEPPKGETPPSNPQAPPKTSQAQNQEQIIRVAESRLDYLMNLIGELVILKNRMININERDADDFYTAATRHDLRETTEFLNRLSSDLQSLIMDVRMVPIANAFSKFPRMVRDFAAAHGKKIDLIIEGKETEVDKTIVEKIGDPLVHLVRNAIDHGLEPAAERAQKNKNETGRLHLSARNEGESIIIEIQDDGRGMDAAVIRQKAVHKGLIRDDQARKLDQEESLNLIFLPGFSTAETVTDVSGRGVGMDVVKENVKKLNGDILIETELGKGTKFSLRLPLTLAIVKALMVNINQTTYGIPLNAVSAILKAKPSDIHSVGGYRSIFFRDKTLNILPLAQVFNYPEIEMNGDKLSIMVVSSGSKEIGYIVDNFVGSQDVVVKPVDEQLEGVDLISGSAILGDGRIALIINPNELVKSTLSNSPTLNQHTKA